MFIHDTPPCKNCTDRHIGCHNECENYKSWRVEHKQRFDKIQAAEKVRRDLIATEVGFSEQYRKSRLRQRNYR